MENEPAYNAIKSINKDTKIRVYLDFNHQEFVIMLEGDSLTTGNYAVIDHQYNDGGEGYIDEDHEIQTDADGVEYVEWRNGDFSTPYELDMVLEALSRYN